MRLNRRTALAGAAPLLARRARAETTIRIAVQPGLTYLALNIVEHQHLIEQQAAALGAPGVKAEFLRLAAGNNVNDAVISGARLDVSIFSYPAPVLRATVGDTGHSTSPRVNHPS